MVLLIKKKCPKPYMLICKKLPKLDEKTKKKTKDSINKKPPKFDKKTKKKLDYLLLYRE